MFLFVPWKFAPLSPVSDTNIPLSRENRKRVAYIIEIVLTLNKIVSVTIFNLVILYSTILCTTHTSATAY